MTEKAEWKQLIVYVDLQFHRKKTCLCCIKNELCHFKPEYRYMESLAFKTARCDISREKLRMWIRRHNRLALWCYWSMNESNKHGRRNSYLDNFYLIIQTVYDCEEVC